MTQQQDTSDNENEPAQSSNDHSLLMTSYLNTVEALQKAKADYDKKEYERKDYQPYTWNNLHAYTNVTLQNSVMNKSNSPRRPPKYGLKPKDVQECECCRNLVLQIVPPNVSHSIDQKITLCERHQRQKQQEDEKYQDENDKEKSPRKSRNDKHSKDKENEKKQEKEENDDDDDVNYIPYQLIRPRKVRYGKFDLRSERAKKEDEERENSNENEDNKKQKKHKVLNDIITYDKVKLLRKQIKEQNKMRSQQRFEKNYEQTKKDWAVMQLGDLEVLARDEDKKRMRVPCIQYLGTFKQGSRKAVQELTADFDPNAESDYSQLHHLLDQL